MALPIAFVREGVTVFTSALYQTTSTLLETPDAVFVVDPNWLPVEVERIAEYVESIRRKRKLFLIFTHADYDHILGCGAFPGARIIASRTFANLHDKAQKVQDIMDFDARHYITRSYPISFPDVDIAIANDGKSMHFSGHVLTFYQAPGHTPDGLMIVCEPSGVLIAGDYLSDVEFPFVNDSFAGYRRTMAKIDRILHLHKPDLLIPGHGTICSGANEIKSRRDASLEYLDDLAATTGTVPFPIAKYRSRYPHWEGLRDEHKANLAKFSVRE